MSYLTFGNASETMLDELRLRVDVYCGGWRYTIWRGDGTIAAHDPCWPENQTEDTARVEAVTEALEILRRNDDPASVSRALTWI
jgi:hypothetical protein